MLNIGQAAITGLFIAVPPLREQQQLVSLVRSEAVSLLIERRAALITAAATGKIDVRGLVPQPEAVAA